MEKKVESNSISNQREIINSYVKKEINYNGQRDRDDGYSGANLIDWILKKW